MTTLTVEQGEQFEQLFSIYYDERDHWQDYEDWGAVTSKLKGLRYEHEQGRALDISEQDVKDHFRAVAYTFARERLEELHYRFNHITLGNLDRLLEIIRYDQTFTLELCEIVTGERFKRLSNARIKGLVIKILAVGVLSGEVK